ncbi:hypothetical protein AK812_SmicGene43494 [Symbiodinium microadriaticum]|uniref:Uncharacterized protein n=1 Tax=Symbiodinium microadriaticum TaxID=2951 RepID=A0A1Q9C0W3_SYMMI|nr:hypothetical protein AK812_SmicGene43494 [Symbiodinium microadriaticum]
MTKEWDVLIRGVRAYFFSDSDADRLKADFGRSDLREEAALCQEILASAAYRAWDYGALHDEARPKHGGQHGQSRDNRVERRAGKIAWQEQRIEELEQEAARLNSAQELRAECDGEIAKRKAAEEEVVQAVQAKHRCRGRDGQDEKRTMLQICGVQM